MIYLLPGDTFTDEAKGLIYIHPAVTEGFTEEQLHARLDEKGRSLSEYRAAEQRSREEAAAREAERKVRLEQVETLLSTLLDLSPRVREVLQEWHELRGWDCCAHGEGQDCCLDELLGDHESRSYLPES